MKKLLSIIIPMYNSYEFIEKCLNSLIMGKKEMLSLEVVVVNDGSTDGCEKLVVPYIEKYPETIRMVEQPNGGHGAAINHGVNECQGKYFKILDADDWISTNTLKNLLLKINNKVSADVLLNSFQTYNISTGENIEYWTGKPRLMTMHSVLKEWNQYKWIFSLHGIIYRTEFYRKLNKPLPEHVYYDDAFFYTVCASYANTIQIIEDKPLYIYRIGDLNQSISNKNREIRINQLEKVIDAMLSAGKQIDEKNVVGKKYWKRKMLIAISDYYITTFLRFEDRKEGREKAKQFTIELKNKNIDIYQATRKKYWEIKILGILNFDTLFLEKIVNLKKF